MADNYIIHNEYGSIMINRSVIVRIVSDVVDETKGVRLASLKEILPKVTQNIDVSFDENGAAQIHFYVAVKFGTSISNATYKMINEVKARVYSLTLVDPASVTVTVAGTEMNKRTKRRHLVFGTNR